MTAEIRDDLRHAARMARTQPGFAAAAILTLALGIGAATAIFTVVNAVLINPLPYPDSDRLVLISHTVGGRDLPYFSDAIFTTYAENTRTFQDFGAWNDDGTTATITGVGEPEEVRAWIVSRGVLTTLGVQPEIGRWFAIADDTPGAPDVVILTSAYWNRKFGADPAVLRRTLAINGRPHQIIGVMPAGFRFGGDPEVLLPLRIDRARPIPSFRLQGLARLKPGVSLAEANADVARIIDIWLVKGGQTDPAFRARYGPSLRPLKQEVVGDVSRTLWILMGTIGIVLLMACANVANLLLVRADGRRPEFAIRSALGAPRSRIARQLLVENLVLALSGGALGLAIAYAGLRLLVAIAPANLPRLTEISIEPRVLAFALTASLASGFLFGLLPILKYSGPNGVDAITGGRGGGLSRERQRSQLALVTVQMALALVLLVSSGLMIRSFQALRRVDPGFARPDRIQTFAVSIPETTVSEPERVTRMQQQILDGIAAIPGVDSAAFMTRLPSDPENRYSAALRVQGRADDGRTPPNHHVKIVSPGTFETLGTPLVAGRDFTWADLYGAREVVIVSESLARELWESPQAALGKRLREYYGRGGPWREIVGVAADVHEDGAHMPPPPTAYWPGRWYANLFGVPGYQPRRVSVVIRSERSASSGLLGEVRKAVWTVNPNLPLAQVRTLQDVYAGSMGRTSFTLVMLAVAGAMALILGIVGLYGVISYAVARRRREIGIRVALGAQAPDIRRLFMTRGLIVAGVGTAIGLCVAAGLAPLMRSLLFGIGPLDPLTFAVTPVVLAAAAVLASYLPARRAVAVDPVETLRAE
jgi:putative ABC transport system permease protein